MATTLDARGIRLFDYVKMFAELLRDAIKAHATRVAAEAGVECARRTSPSGRLRLQWPLASMAELLRGTGIGLSTVNIDP
jgi:hypothetical protein